jgi:hypothetical protein
MSRVQRKDSNAPRQCATYQLPGQPAIQFSSRSRAILGRMKHSVILTTPTAETPALSDEERLQRRRRFIERVFSPDGLDRDTLTHIEQLAGEER